MLEGRKVFANILKYIGMGASSSFGNMFSVLGASIFLPYLPMIPIQILTNNLLYDVSQTAEALHQALLMPRDERAERSARLSAAATALPPQRWFADQLAALD